MKKLSAVLVVLFTSLCHQAFAQTNNVGIGTSTPSASSLLDVSSTDKGVLLPRMTQAQRDSIVTPAAGLLIYQTDNTPGFYYYRNGWKPVSSSPTNFANKTLSNLDASTEINSSLLPVSLDSVDLGRDTMPWRNLYLSKSVFLAATGF